MLNQDAFESWAPPHATWSAWAKPVVFAQLDLPATASAAPPPVSPPDTSWVPNPQAGTALVVELPGPDAVTLGLALAGCGYRPVPLFNACHGPNAVVPLEPIRDLLARGASQVAGLHLPDDAPPAFLLDSRRLLPLTPPTPGKLDNRWMVFPQDFPSATFLAAHGLPTVLWIVSQADQPQDDLAHVLLRWQQAGLRIQRFDMATKGSPQDVQVRRPRRFRWLWYVALAALGLRRSSAGGFGGIVPHPSSG